MGRLQRKLFKLPKGVGQELYRAAMKNISLPGRPTARSLMLKHGSGMAKALSVCGPRVLKLVKDHGRTAAKAIAAHEDAVSLFDEHGSVVFPVLSHLEPGLRDRVGSLSIFENTAANERVFNLYQAYLRAPDDVRTLLLTTPEELLDAKLVDLVKNRGKNLHR